MREILFRGKRIDNGEWVKGDLRQYKNFKNCEDFCCIDTMPVENGFGISYEVDTTTLCEFTGLYDKDSKEGFTNDIVKVKSNVTGKCSIYCLVFDETRLHYGFRTIRHGYYYNLDEMIEEEVGDDIEIEIIGNIYDNPELLKGEDNG